MTEGVTMNDRTVNLLSEYIQINTTNPPGNESKAVTFFENIFIREGIEYKIYEPETDRASIRAILHGSGEKQPVILLNHMDVVPAENQDWTVDPFGGEVKDGFIYGRGALDMKSLGIMELMAFLEIKNSGVTPSRDIIFLATADEETGGKHGVDYLLENHPEDFSAEFVINEGGFGISGLLPDRPVFMISTAEKGLCWLKVKSTGQPGHSSVPHGQNALEKLNAAIHRLLSEKTPITLTPIIKTYFNNLGLGWDFLEPFLKDQKAETLGQILEQTGFIQMPQISAMLKNTISLTQIHSGNKTNVIPASAEATMDIRLLPGYPIDDYLNQMKDKMGDDDLTFDIIAQSEASSSPPDTPYFHLMEEAIKEQYPEALVTPSLLFATSDSRLFRKHGITTYGFCPAIIGIEDVQRIHGIDERISIENMINGTKLFTKIVRKLCM
jgi:acetylornithine deacetylase/succinyl-diaminopimelate desuccinylase-like protein